MKNLVKKWNDTSLILRIAVGLVIGAVLGVVFPKLTVIALLGNIFVGALKAIAPILVFVLVMSSLAQAGKGIGKKFRTVIILYMLSTLLAAVIAVLGSFMFPVQLKLTGVEAAGQTAPTGIGEVLEGLLNNMVSNPVSALMNANYVGILCWSIILGLALKSVASDHTKEALSDISNAVTQAVRWIISLAPFGIMGLV